MELLKRKKIAREIIEKGMQKEFEKALSDADKILQDWKNNRTDNQSAYYSLYKQIDGFDKHIAIRYERITRPRLLLIIIGQLRDGIISENELEDLPEVLQLRLKSFID